MKMRRSLSISAKIACIFTILIFFSVLIFSAFMITLTKNSLLRQRTKDLLQALDLVETSVRESGGEEASLRSAAIPYYILYRVSLPDGTAIKTNDPLVPLLPGTPAGKAERYFEKDFFSDGDLNLLYTAKNAEGPSLSAPGGAETYHIQTAMDMDLDDTDLMLQRMPLIFLLCSLPLLVLSCITALLISAHILLPVKKIITQAREISSEHLDRRLDESGADDELKELARTFNALFARLEKDFDRQKRFTSDAAHELKTPIAVITGYTDMLCRWGKDNPAVLNEALGVLRRESRSMASLTEDLLTLARAENSLSVKYEKAPVPLLPFFGQICKDFSVIAPEARISVECGGQAVLQTNSEALKQVLRIIIRNSIAYSTPPADITVSFSDNTLTVSDRGRGIPEKDLPRIFDRFYRTDESRSRATGGSGLGLSIAKAVTEKMGASIRAESVAGEGTSVIITFP